MAFLLAVATVIVVILAIAAFVGGGVDVVGKAVELGRDACQHTQGCKLQGVDITLETLPVLVMVICLAILIAFLAYWLMHRNDNKGEQVLWSQSDTTTYRMTQLKDKGYSDK